MTSRRADYIMRENGHIISEQSKLHAIANALDFKRGDNSDIRLVIIIKQVQLILLHSRLLCLL